MVARKRTANAIEINLMLISLALNTSGVAINLDLGKAVEICGNCTIIFLAIREIGSFIYIYLSMLEK